MLRTYSPIKPRKKSCTPPKKKIEMIIVGIPEVDVPSEVNESKKYTTPAVTPRADITNPKSNAILAGICVVETIPLIATSARTSGDDLLFPLSLFFQTYGMNRDFAFV
jgi:hypothetical protein